MLPNVTKEDQIQEFLNSLPIVVPRISTFVSLNITLDDLEYISEHFYPLCMQHIHNTLKSFHHLKHDSRKQYGIFLKNLGLPYDDAMTFFEQEFTKSMTKDWFRKKYAYYFKHFYGKVGGMIDYKPHSCITIQNMTLLPDQHHGCPFKHWDKDILFDKLRHEGLCSSNIRDIEDLVSEKKFQQACTKYYCIKRKAFKDIVIESPNQYCADGITHDITLDNVLESICDTV